MAPYSFQDPQNSAQGLACSRRKEWPRHVTRCYPGGRISMGEGNPGREGSLVSVESRKWLQCMGRGHGRTVRWLLSHKSGLQLPGEPTAPASGCGQGKQISFHWPSAFTVASSASTLYPHREAEAWPGRLQRQAEQREDEGSGHRGDPWAKHCAQSIMYVSGLYPLLLTQGPDHPNPFSGRRGLDSEVNLLPKVS